MFRDPAIQGRPAEAEFGLAHIESVGLQRGGDEIALSFLKIEVGLARRRPRGRRLYFDHGSETLDAIYARYQERVDAVVARRGYKQGVNWLTRSFPGQKHNEISWASRVNIPLRFLLPPR